MAHNGPSNRCRRRHRLTRHSVCASPPTVRQYSRLLPEDDDFAGSPLNRFRKGGTSHKVIGDKCNEFFDAGVVVVPHLDPVWQFLLLIQHASHENIIGTSVKTPEDECHACAER